MRVWLQAVTKRRVSRPYLPRSRQVKEQEEKEEEEEAEGEEEQQQQQQQQRKAGWAASSTAGTLQRLC